MPLIYGIVLILSLIVIWMYNTLIARKNDVARSFSSIDVMLKMRHDLIPALVGTAGDYMQYEKGLLKDLTELRTRAMGAVLSDNERMTTENEITKKLGNLMFAAENYPGLKADSSFLQLQAAWNDAEQQLAASRRAYNAAVTEFNNAVEMFPSNLMASAMNYRTKPLFEAAAAEKTTPASGNMGA